MITPCLCFTCGYPVGDVDDVFRLMRTQRVKEILSERGTDPIQVAVDAGLQIDCSDIFDKLRIRYPCCRKVLTSAMKFSDYYA